MGAFIGHHHRNYLFNKQHWVLSIASILLWAICFTGTFIYGHTALDVPTRLLASFCFMGLYDGLDRLLHFRPHRIYTFSFFIYALHYIPLGLGKNAILQHLPAPLSYHLAYWCYPILCVAGCILAAWLLQRFFPRAYSKLSGGR